MQHLQFIKLHIVRWSNQKIKTFCHLRSQEPVTKTWKKPAYKPPEVIVFKSFIGTDWLDDDCLKFQSETESLWYFMCLQSSITKCHRRGKSWINIYEATTFPKDLTCPNWIYLSIQSVVGTQLHTPKHLFQWAALTQLFRGETCC